MIGNGPATTSRPTRSAFSTATGSLPTRAVRWRPWSFAAQVMERPGFEPWHLRVVTDETGAVVGVAFIVIADGTGFVEKPAVREDRRGLGLGRALLVDAFEQARADGATRSELSTDSRTGALGLYERVGMEATSVWVNRAIDL